MNNKISRYARAEGFCCPWAFFEAHRTTYTSVLYKPMAAVCTMRALQQRRAKYRSGETKCEHAEECLKARIRQARGFA
jgi:hypothetical protein